MKVEYTDFYIVFLVYLFAIPELQSTYMIGKVDNVKDMFQIKEKNRLALNLLPFEPTK